MYVRGRGDAAHTTDEAVLVESGEGGIEKRRKRRLMQAVLSIRCTRRQHYAADTRKGELVGRSAVGMTTGVSAGVAAPAGGVVGDGARRLCDGLVKSLVRPGGDIANEGCVDIGAAARERNGCSGRPGILAGTCVKLADVGQLICGREGDGGCAPTIGEACE
jgi:hypothetical protein